jgi:hypothetical protein
MGIGFGFAIWNWNWNWTLWSVDIDIDIAFELRMPLLPLLLPRNFNETSHEPPAKPQAAVPVRCGC